VETDPDLPPRDEFVRSTGDAGAAADRYNEGVALWGADRVADALHAFRDAAAAGDKDAEYALGRGLLWVGDTEEAVALLGRLSSGSGELADLAAGDLGRHLLGVGSDIGRATRLLGRAAAAHPEYRSDYAQALAASGQKPDAVELLERETRQGSRDAPIVLGNIYLELGDDSSAEQAYRTGFQRGDAHSAYNLAALLADRGDMAGSRRWLQAAADGGDEWAAGRLAGLGPEA
jgi:thioredoxin-like negative regulator of GroEL